MYRHQAEPRLLVSPDSTMQLVKCPECPSPGLVLAQEMSQHISLHHRGQGFRCAVCQVRAFDSTYKTYNTEDLENCVWNN